MTAEILTGQQAALRERARDLFPGGVNSPVRAFRTVAYEQAVLRAGRGAHVVDADGRDLIDYIGGWGPAILGHAHPAVMDAIRVALDDGLALGATHPREIELGIEVRERMPSLERMRFTSSGTEAAMSALRVARAATGRDLVVKFAGAYHGHADALLADAGSGVATFGIPGSAGVPASVAATTLVLPFNDLDAVKAAFDRHRDAIAAVIVEPVIANAGVIPPAPGYLEGLRAETERADALLVFDEVITGFRVARGGAQERFGVRPDLTVLGKIVGGGMPVGAYGGPAALMSLVAPEGPVYQAGTLSGHPLTMAAGLATLRELDAPAYDRLEKTAAQLESGLRKAADEAGARAAIARLGSLLTVFFAERVPANGEEALASDRHGYAVFFGAMLDAGILLPPSPYEAWFVSLAHGRAELERTVDAAREAFAAAAGR